MKKRALLQLTLLASVVSATPVLAQTSTAPKPSVPTKTAAKPDPTKQTDVGQRKFNANCGRCHSFPEQLRPSITGTVVRHMRVRANLSAEDEKDILRFFSP
jgi:mono/diheme cytochrome c family protein